MVDQRQEVRGGLAILPDLFEKVNGAVASGSNSATGQVLSNGDACRTARANARLTFFASGARAGTILQFSFQLVAPSHGTIILSAL